MEKTTPNPVPTLPANWRRVVLQISAVQPAPGKIISLERGPHLWKVVVCAPAWVWTMLVLTGAASHPWAAWVVDWVRKLSVGGG